jgi:hypothetical protein
MEPLELTTHSRERHGAHARVRHDRRAPRRRAVRAQIDRYLCYATTPSAGAASFTPVARSLADAFTPATMFTLRRVGGLCKLLGDHDPTKAERTMKAMLQMKKLDIATLKRAHAG